jgi:hypothetical protein
MSFYPDVGASAGWVHYVITGKGLSPGPPGTGPGHFAPALNHLETSPNRLASAWNGCKTGIQAGQTPRIAA